LGINLYSHRFPDSYDQLVAGTGHIAGNARLFPLGIALA